MSDMLSQEEIDALLSGSNTSDNNTANESVEFAEVEKDAIGEIGNISMGTAATTLSTLLGNKVTITTPRVSLVTMQQLEDDYPVPFVASEVRYKEGIEGMNLLIIKVDDVKIITDLMMGGSGVVTEDPLSELHLSAVAEAMNQMVGSASTSLSEMFSKKIDIHPPKVFELNLQSGKSYDDIFSDDKEQLVRIAFRMEIEGLIDSEIMQLIPIDFAKEMIDILMPRETIPEEAIESPTQEIFPQSQDLVDDDFYSRNEPSTTREEKLKRPQKINAQPVQFQSFDAPSSKGTPENIALIQDVPLKVTVELGRTQKKISDVLEFGPGTIIELDKLVGEPLDILVNGQYVAKGEVVVIDENYGIRVTDIVNPHKRINKI
ncbi:MAG: flagellar motor switch phosphatase FliY [Clostridiaceae bacterium]|nr:flagellar motor switch phosphatase FliY [Clostridiaceae bacterium]